MVQDSNQIVRQLGDKVGEGASEERPEKVVERAKEVAKIAPSETR